MRPIDYLVVGQGLAGTMMAYHLLKEQKNILVVDDGKRSASAIAAGLFNPVTGRRFVKSWRIEELLPYAETVYKEFEEALSAKLFFQVPIIHYLSGNEEKKIFEKSIQTDRQQYIAGFTPSSQGTQYATCEIKGGGYVDTHTLIYGFRQYLSGMGSYVEEGFDYADLKINEGQTLWKGMAVGAVVFCEGYGATNNPFFPDLPFNPAKGEIMTVKIPGLNSDKIIMSGGYMVPLGNDMYRLGSTYEWTDLSLDITETGREKLLGILAKMTDLPYQILDQQVGIRPAVVHRRPLLGRSAVADNIYILNGLGTKGVILSPFFAKQLTSFIIDGNPIDNEVNIGIYPKPVQSN